MARPNLLGRSREELERIAIDLGQPAFRGRQLYRWLYGRRSADWEAMTDLPATLRGRLSTDYVLLWPEVVQRVEARDGTRKYLLSLPDGRRIESVYMPDSAGERVTLCVSSQVGCALGCTFCRTAEMGLVRDLDAGEIFGQIARLCDDNDLEPPRFNVVLMGMGEPLQNLDAVLGAFERLTSPDGGGMSWRRFHVSTVGDVRGIERLARAEHRPRLAVSLNATTDEMRSRIMPINRRYPIATLMGALRAYPLRRGEHVTIEYVVLAGMNDAADDAARLVRWLHGIHAKVNLIPYNGEPPPFHRPSESSVNAFRERLVGAGVPCSIRWSKGLDIDAACGQLATSERRADRTSRNDDRETGVPQSSCPVS